MCGCGDITKVTDPAILSFQCFIKNRFCGTRNDQFKCVNVLQGIKSQKYSFVRKLARLEAIEQLFCKLIFLIFILKIFYRNINVINWLLHFSTNI